MSLKNRKSDAKHETLALCRRLQPAADLRVLVCRPVAVGEVFLYDAKHDRPGIVGFANRDCGMHDDVLPRRARFRPVHWLPAPASWLSFRASPITCTNRS